MLHDRIIDVLEDTEEETLIYWWNEYCENNRYYEDRIYFMYELNDLFSNCTATDFFNAIDTDSFDLTDDYFVDGIYGVKTLSDVYDVIYIDDLADYIEDNEETFGDYELEELFEEEEEEDD